MGITPSKQENTTAPAVPTSTACESEQTYMQLGWASCSSSTSFCVLCCILFLCALAMSGYFWKKSRGEN